MKVLKYIFAGIGLYMVLGLIFNFSLDFKEDPIDELKLKQIVKDEIEEGALEQTLKSGGTPTNIEVLELSLKIIKPNEKYFGDFVLQIDHVLYRGTAKVDVSEDRKMVYVDFACKRIPINEDF